MSHFNNLFYVSEKVSEITSGQFQRLSSNCQGQGKPVCQSREAEDPVPLERVFWEASG